MRAATPKLLAVDLDGTLIARDGGICESDVLAIRRLREAGIVVTIATGRTPAGALHVGRNLDLSGPCVCTDGAMIVEIQKGDVLRHRSVGGDVSKTVASAIEKFPNLSATVLVGNVVVLDERGSMLERVARSWSPLLEETPRLLEHDCWSSEEGITAAAIIGLREEIASIVDTLSAEPLELTHFDVTRYDGISSVIVHAEGVSKGAGLAWLADHHGLTIENTVAVGDWLNDVSMLKVAPQSFAMAHAPEPVKSAAKHVLEASRSGGAIAEIAKRVWSL